jgi:hypothetical protein
MTKRLLLLALLCACAPKEEAKTDTAAAAPAMAPAPATPAPLTAAAVAGGWNGTSMAEGSDSVTLRWTTTSTPDGGGQLVYEGGKDTVPYTRIFDADSMVATSSPFVRPGDKTKTKVMFRSIGRLQGDKLVGTSATMLASKPDSVISRSHWEATKQP